MCGIFGYVGVSMDVSSLVLKGLKTLEYRGYDSWGVAVKEGKGVYLEKHVGKIGDAKLPAVRSTSGIGHTRWATHGGVTKSNAHPHTDCTGDVVVVHNGIIENFQGLKKSLVAKGHTFKSETDTEVFAHLVEESLKDSSDIHRAVMHAVGQITGLSAIIVYIPRSDVLYVYKNSSPIVFGTANEASYVASDSSALIGLTDSAYYLEDGEMLALDTRGYTLFDTRGKKKKPRFIPFEFTSSDAGLGSYKHFMIKEIHEQPRVLEGLIAEYGESIEEYAKLIKASYGTYFIGCGTAAYACLAGTYLFSKIAKRHVNFGIGSEFSYLVDFIKKTSLVVALSQSGETIDIISTIQKVKDKHAKVLAITNAQGSTLYRLADKSLLLHAGPEKAVASTKAYTAKIALLYMLAHSLAGSLPAGIAQLHSAIRETERLIGEKRGINTIAKQIVKAENIFVLGRGVSYSAALESALKMKEVSYIHAEGYACGELKHGPIALIEKGTPVLLFNPHDETYEDTLSAAHEVKARGATVIGVSSINNDVYDHYIHIADCNDATIIPNVVIAQLLGYYLATLKGLDPDKPRNLAKSVTVK